LYTRDSKLYTQLARLHASLEGEDFLLVPDTNGDLVTEGELSLRRVFRPFPQLLVEGCACFAAVVHGFGHAASGERIFGGCLRASVGDPELLE
jgi:hypothetical protein